MGAEFSKESTGFLQELAQEIGENANKGSNIVVMNPVIHIHTQDRISNSTDNAKIITELQAEIKMKDNQIEFERQQKEIVESFLQELYGRREESFYMEKEPISQLCGHIDHRPWTIDDERPLKRRKLSKSETNFKNDSTELWETSDGTKFIHLNQNSNSWKRNTKEDDSQSNSGQQISEPECTNFVVHQSPTRVPASIPSTLCETENTPVFSLDKSTNVDMNTTNLSPSIAASDTTNVSLFHGFSILSNVSISLDDSEIVKLFDEQC